MRKLGPMDHTECAPWCDHDPEHHAEDCSDSYCSGCTAQETEARIRDRRRSARLKVISITQSSYLSTDTLADMFVFNVPYRPEDAGDLVIHLADALADLYEAFLKR